MGPLKTTDTEVDDDVTGLTLSIENFDHLADVIAVIAMGQSKHAINIINSLSGGPAVLHADLFRGARGQLQIKGDTEEKRTVSRYHRDGFLFECISWIVARQDANARTLMKDPHIKSTTQGLDGLVLELHPVETEIISATIFEDKCSEFPRNTFRDKVLPSFTSHHTNERCTDLLANAADLIKSANISEEQAVIAASRILDSKYRSYRATLTIGDMKSSKADLQSLFKGYNSLSGILKSQRIGAVLPLSGDLRDWFESLAEAVIKAINNFESQNV